MAAESTRPKLKTAFKNVRTIGPLHTSGPVTVTPDGGKIVTCVGEDVLLTDVSQGTNLCRFAGDSQSATALCISPSSQHLVIFSSSLSLRVYDIPTSFPVSVKTIHPIRVVARAHDGPVHACKIDPTSSYLASGSADGVVKVWDIHRGYVTHVFKGHGGVVSALTFNYPIDPSSVLQAQTMQLITASVDTRIRIFELSATASKDQSTMKPRAVLEGHVSVPRGLDVTPDGKWLISGGRDSVVLLWDLFSTQPVEAVKRGKGKRNQTDFNVMLAKTIPILERVEAVGFVDLDDAGPNPEMRSNHLHFFTAGEKGVLKVWDGRAGTMVCQVGSSSQTEDEREEQRQIIHALYLPSPSTPQIMSVHADQNILFHSLVTKSLTQQLIGFNDEIVDATFLTQPSPSRPRKNDTHIALATNSSLIRVYSSSTLDARLLSGHTDIVLSLDASSDGRILASGSKDRSARLWASLEADDSHDWGWNCIAVCEGHAASIGAIAMSRKRPANEEEDTVPHRFMFTGSQDRTIKMWDLSLIPLAYTEIPESPVKCRSLVTQKAHEKDINALDVSPDDRFLASGSQDRSAKIYEIEYFPSRGSRSARGELKVLGTCKGHKRGVWTVRFSRAERLLATGSGDKTVKLWNLQDFSCVKTFEGHTNSVLRVDFLNSGMQMVSAASDGLVKLWNVRDEECVATMDNHQDKVWALAVSNDERTIVSGAADSIVTFWEDCTEEQVQLKEAKRAEMVLKDQDFGNYLSIRNYQKAIELALTMAQPGRLFKLFKDIRSNGQPSSITGDKAVDQVIQTLSGPDLVRILRYVRDWNANAKTSEVAQDVLYAIFKLRTVNELIGAFKLDSEFAANPAMNAGDNVVHGNESMPLKDIVEALIPYTERHLARMERLVQDSYVVDYVLGEMDDGMFDGMERSTEDIMDVDIGATATL